MSIALFEGMDGTGKSTLVQNVADRLVKAGKSVKTQAFPSKEGAIGKFIREEIFTGKQSVDERAMLHLMVSDAVDFDAKLGQWDQEYDYVLLDRHSIVSSWAYQIGSHTPNDVAAVASVHFFNNLPSAIFILDIDEKIAVKRQAERRGPVNALYEKGEQYAKELRQRYMAFAALFAQKAPVVVIDAGQPPELLADIITESLIEQGVRAAG